MVKDREGVQKPECVDCEVTWVAYGPDQYAVRGVALCPLHKAAPRMLELLDEAVNEPAAMLTMEYFMQFRKAARAILRDVEGGNG